MNGILIIDKPQGWTSHDVVAKLRGLLGVRRIGHAGTLDPIATGVLAVFVGQATRAVEFAQADDKAYIAGLKLGLVTDTQDITGAVLQESGKVAGRREVASVLERFRGEIAQLPPMYSAVKIGGKKLYELARKGQQIERTPRRIHVYEIEILEETEDGYTLRVRCSKGTYIRALCHDIGAYLGCGGVMSSLRRTRSGRFSIEDAVTLQEVEAEQADRSRFLRPVDQMFFASPAVALSPVDERKYRCGQRLTAESGTEEGLCRVYSGQTGEFLALGKIDRGGDCGPVLRSVKNFFAG